MDQNIYGSIHASKVNLPGPLVAGSCDPVDARLVAATLADITTNAETTFKGDLGYCFIYEGIQIYIADEQATYMYVGPSNASGIAFDDVKKVSNWVKVASKDGVATSTTVNGKTADEDGNITVTAQDITINNDNSNVMLSQYLETLNETLSNLDSNTWNKDAVEINELELSKANVNDGILKFESSKYKVLIEKENA